jgi:hypothetical protein
MNMALIDVAVTVLMTAGFVLLLQGVFVGLYYFNYYIINARNEVCEFFEELFYCASIVIRVCVVLSAILGVVAVLFYM